VTSTHLVPKSRALVKKVLAQRSLGMPTVFLKPTQLNLSSE